MRIAIARTLLRTATGTRQAAPVRWLAPQVVQANRTMFTSAPLLKKSKAAAVKKANKQAKDDAKADGRDVDKDLGVNIDEVLAKTKKTMEKAVSWARAIVYEGVERGRGRVTPALLDGVKVTTPDVPGAQPLSSVASVTVKAGALFINLWDSSHTKQVEKAIHEANLPGLSPVKVSDDTLKVPVARPTHEQRQEILKNLGQTVETAKNQVRRARSDGMNSLGGRKEPGSEEVEKLADVFGGELNQVLAQAKKEFEKV